MSQSQPQQPLVSIITPSYNQAQFIEKAILSVAQQDYPAIEHLVMDGGSTDGTLDILRQYDHCLTWISEADRGQAHAINKGFRMAKGTIFGWLNADDLYAPKAISQVVAYFMAYPEAQFVYGDALAINRYGRPYGLRVNVQAADLHYLTHIGDPIIQPAAFWRAEVWRTLGELDEALHYNLDYEYWMRAARQFELHYMPRCLAWERLYADAKTFRGDIERMVEMEQVARLYGGDGIPANFRSEAASYYFLRAVDAVFKGQWTMAWQTLQLMAQTNNSVSKLLLYLGALILFGDGGIPYLRLLSNSIRAKLRGRQTCE